MRPRAFGRRARAARHLHYAALLLHEEAATERELELELGLGGEDGRLRRRRRRRILGHRGAKSFHRRALRRRGGGKPRVPPGERDCVPSPAQIVSRVTCGDLVLWGDFGSPVRALLAGTLQ